MTYTFFKTILLLVLVQFCTVDCKNPHSSVTPSLRLSYSTDSCDNNDDGHHLNIYRTNAYNKHIFRTKHRLNNCRGGGGGETNKATSATTQTVNRKATVAGLKNSLASSLGAVCAKAVLAPFDTIKTIQQGSKSASANAVSLKFLDATKLVMDRGNGIFGFYAGLGVAAIGSMPSVGLYFGIYSYSKGIIGPYLQQHFGTTTSSLSSKMAKRDALLRTLTIATSAAIGNSIASISRVPYEVVKQKLQMNQYPNTWVAITSMLQSSSSSSRFSIAPFFPLGGISSQMARDIPYAIFTLLTYEYLRDHWVNPSKYKQQQQNLSAKSKMISGWWRDMVTGAIAGGVGSYLTNPMDVIKTRLQTNNYDAVTGGKVYLGIWDCACRIYMEEGPCAFLKGSVPRLMHKIPANAVFFLSYELFRRVLRVENQNHDDGKK